MRALTLHEPYASLVAEGYKLYETRPRCPKSMVGQRIAIHAGKKMLTLAEMQALPEEVVDFVSDKGGIRELPYGAIVASATLVRVHVVIEQAINNQRALVQETYPPTYRIRHIKTDPYGDFSQGRYIWELGDISKVDEPIPMRGFQGFWTLPEGVNL